MQTEQVYEMIQREKIIVIVRYFVNNGNAY
jgi:hypothetical protein